jgi:hypothetical protein
MKYFWTLFGKELYMFRKDLLSISRILNTVRVFTAIGIYHLFANRQSTLSGMTNTNYCEYSIKNSDDGQ